MRAYLIGLAVEPFEVGTEYEVFPLHCTLMPWFKTTKKPEEVEELVKATCEKRQPIELFGGPIEQFGVNTNILVNTLMRTVPLLSLHAALLIALNRWDVVHAFPQFIGARFRPHVTIVDNRALPEGGSKVADQLYIAEARDPQKIEGKKIFASVTLRA